MMQELAILAKHETHSPFCIPAWYSHWVAMNRDLATQYSAQPVFSEKQVEERYQSFVSESYARQEAEREAEADRLIEKLSEETTGKRRIVYFAETPYFSILRQAKTLRNAGYETVLLCMKPIPEELSTSFENAFDLVGDDLRSFVTLGRLAGSIKAFIFHIQCWMWGYHTARRIIECANDVPCVCEFYDVTSAVTTRENLYRMLSSRPDPIGMVDMDLSIEGFLFRNADGVVHRLTSRLINEIRKSHASNVADLQFMPWPDSVPDPSTSGKLSNEYGKPCLVYAGAVHPSSSDPGLSPLALFSKTVVSLLEQGCVIHIYNDPHRMPGRTDPDYTKWFEIESRFPTFKMLKGVGPERLPVLLSRYDFGLLLTEYTPEVLQNRKRYFEGAMGTKIFSYLEAGLPVLVNSEAKLAGKFVEENAIGLAFDADQSMHFPDTLKNTDYRKLVKNVGRYCQVNLMSNRISEMIEFYELVTGRKNQ